MFDKLYCIIFDLMIQFSPYIIWAICFIFLLCGAVSLDFYNTYVSMMPILTLITMVRFYRHTNGEQLFNIHPYGGGIYLMQGLIPWLLAQQFTFIGLELALFFLVMIHYFSDSYLTFLENNLIIHKIKSYLSHKIVELKQGFNDFYLIKEK